MKYYIMMFACGILCAMQFTFTKMYQDRESDSFNAGMVFNVLSGILATAFFLVINGFKFEITWYSLLLSVVQSLCIIGYTMLGFKVMSLENVGNYTFYLMTGGMVLPFFYGIIFLNEKLELVHILGLLILITAMVLINGSVKSGRRTKLLYLAIFILNGITSIVSKLHQVPSFDVVSENGFVTLCNLSKAVLCFVTLLAVTKGKPSFKMQKPSFAIVVMAAFVCGFGYLMQLYSASQLPSTILFPIITGGTIVFSNIADVLVFKEKLPKKSILGTALCVAGICFFV